MISKKKKSITFESLLYYVLSKLFLRKLLLFNKHHVNTQEKKNVESIMTSKGTHRKTRRNKRKMETQKIKKQKNNKHKNIIHK